MSKVDFGVLKDTAPNNPEQATDRSSGYETREVVPSVPSKAAPIERRDKQISIKGPHHVIERFQSICERDRWAYWQMLDMMTEEWERNRAGRPDG